MNHGMGLVEMTMGTAAANTIPEVIIYAENSTTESYRFANYESTLTAQAEFDNFTPLLSNSKYYLIVKPSAEYTFNSAFKVLSDVSGQSPVYQWSLSISNTAIKSGKCYKSEPKPKFKTFGRQYSYKGTSQSFNVPYSGNYELRTWGYGSSSVGLGGYAAGTKQLDDETTLVVDVGGKRADGTYFNTNGTTAIRLTSSSGSSILNYTPQVSTKVNCFFGPYWKMPAGRYTVTFIGTDLDKITSHSAYTIYRNKPGTTVTKPNHYFTVEDYVQTSTYISGTLVADIDTSDDSTAGEGYYYGGLEFILYFPAGSSIPRPSATIVANDLASVISGGGCGSANNVSGVSNSTNSSRIWDGDGKAEIILRTRN